MSPGIDFRRRYPPLLSGTQHRRIAGHGPAECLNRFECFGFLDEANHRIDEHDSEDDPRIHPFMEQRCDDDGHQQDDDQRLVELQQEEYERTC